MEFCEVKQIEAYVPGRNEINWGKADAPERDTERNFRYDRLIDEFICPEGQRLKLRNVIQSGANRYIGTACDKCPARKQCAKKKRRNLTYDFKQEETIRQMRDKLNSENSRQKYLERLSETEPVIGDIKHNWKFTHFICRGKPTALIELGLASTAHNLVKIFNWIKWNKKSRQEIRWNSLMRLRIAG